MALEATTNCWAVADALRPHVTRVVVSNPLATKAIAQAKVKTDKVDAHVLAQLLRCDFLPEVWPPDEATRRLREMTGRRSALVGQRTAMRNRIHSVLAMRLIEAPLKLFNAEGLEWLKTVEIDPQGRTLIDSDLRQLEFLQAEIATLDQELATRGHASDQVKLLMTLPGVDVATAEAMLAAWGDATRFPDADHAASYLGLVPSTQQSAEPVLPRADHQTRQQPRAVDAHPGRAAPRQASRPAGPLLPPPVPQEEPQRGRGGRRAETGHDRLDDAQEQRTLPLRHSQKHGNQAGQAASEGHRPTAQGRRRQRREGGRQTARRQPHRQIAGAGSRQ